MENLIEFITEQAPHAHWYLFAGILLAGANVPISIDVMVIIAALLASQIIPEKTPHLFLSIFLGSMLSAWIAYWMGRLLGTQLSKWSYFAKLLSQERLLKIQSFYAKYGLLTLIIGRFIPFGVRNCIFMTTGMSHTSFKKFIWQDAIACLLWSSTAFYFFYTLGQNYQTLLEHLKIINIVLFSTFGLILISVIGYKKLVKKRKTF